MRVAHSEPGVTDPSAFEQIETVRQSVTVPSASAVTATVTWDAAFPDATYVATVNVVQAEDAVLTVGVEHILSQTATQLTVRVRNQAAVERTGTLHSIGIG